MFSGLSWDWVCLAFIICPIIGWKQTDKYAASCCAEFYSCSLLSGRVKIGSEKNNWKKVKKKKVLQSEILHNLFTRK